MAKRARAEGFQAVGYVRVSTEDQADSGLSLEAQEERIRAYCTMRGLDLVEVVSDPGVSGGKELQAREGGRKVLASIHAGKVAHVVALKLDRLFRDATDCLNVVDAWDKAGVGLHLIDMGGSSLDTRSAMGRMFLVMAAGFAEMERNMTRERTTTAMSHKKAKGERVGTVEYGFQLAADCVHLEPCPAEQEVIGRIKALRACGLSLRKIGRRLEAQGLMARNGGRWHPQTIAQILERAV